MCNSRTAKTRAAETRPRANAGKMRSPTHHMHSSRPTAATHAAKAGAVHATKATAEAASAMRATTTAAEAAPAVTTTAAATTR